MGFFSRQEEAYGETDLELLSQIGAQVAVAVENVPVFQEIAEPRHPYRFSALSCGLRPRRSRRFA